MRGINVSELKHNVVALAKAATALDVPVIVTSTLRDGMWGHTIPELTEVVGEDAIIDRSAVNAWDDERAREAARATGATKLTIAGVLLEVCAAFPAVSALADGYQAYVAVDASGTFNRTKHEAGASAAAAGRRDPDRLRDADGRDPQGQRGSGCR